MSVILKVSMSATPEPFGLHTAISVEPADVDVVVTIPASNGSVTVRLNSDEVGQLVAAVQAGGTPVPDGPPADQGATAGG